MNVPDYLKVLPHPPLRTPTREQYLAGQCSFEDYYRGVIATSGARRMVEPKMLARVREAIAAGDYHLNTIPLGLWDAMAPAWRPIIARALKAHGDFWSLGGSICFLKQLARDSVLPVPTKGESNA